jgi:hypothetical protein
MSTTINHYWIWPRASSISTDGTLQFKTSGVDQNEIHWTAEETFNVKDSVYPAMKWIHQNRNILPPLIDRARIQNELHCEPPLISQPDGVYAFMDADLVTNWPKTLTVPIRVLTIEQATPTLQILNKVTRCNCLVFLHGGCEAAISVGREPTGEQVVSSQALVYIQSLIDDFLGTT